MHVIIDFNSTVLICSDDVLYIIFQSFYSEFLISQIFDDFLSAYNQITHPGYAIFGQGIKATFLRFRISKRPD